MNWLQHYNPSTIKLSFIILGLLFLLEENIITISGYELIPSKSHLGLYIVVAIART